MARPDLPAGTVTLVFTDIEGSTRLLHELGDGYADVLAQHRRLLREAFARHGGVEVDTQGDAFFYAFARASEALAAAEAGQAGLEGGPVRVRMGLHTGEPRATEEGYVGADVHLAARVMGAGHGGQVLVSEATARLVDAELRDLGEHRLKDIERPVRLFQLGEGRFPPLKTLNNSNLPLPQTALLGRKKELADVLRLLRVERARLVTVTGPGGIGKTRFALEAAHELVEEFAHGVWFVGLSALRDPALVLPTIAATLGAKGDLAEHIGDKRLLLVLDNFEQVVDAAADVADVLRICADVQLLVTSREPLHVAGEREYPLRPLPESPAVELFRQRAAVVAPDVEVDYAAAAEISRRLDGLPLAIELAAARTKILSPPQLLERLDRRLPLLTGGVRDAPERQRTLRATIEWSYELLSEVEQRLLRRLAVFAGGWTVDAAEAVCAENLDTLQSLVDKSLVRHEGERFSMLETIREYARERLHEWGEGEWLRRRHAEYFIRLGEEAEASWESRQVHWTETFELEHDNFRAVLAWARDAGDIELELRALACLGNLWGVRGYATEGRRWCESALSRVSEQSELRLRIVTIASRLTLDQGDYERGRELTEERLRLARTLGDRAAVGRCLVTLGLITADLGDHETAKSLYEESRDIFERVDDRVGVAVAVLDLGDLALRQGDSRRARALVEEALASFDELESTDGRASCRHTLGLIALGEGRTEAAAAELVEGLQLFAAIGHPRGVATCLHALAAVLVRATRGDSAGRLLGAGDALLDAAGLHLHQSERDVRERTLADLRAELGERRFRTALQRGRELSLEQAVQYALSTVD